MGRRLRSFVVVLWYLLRQNRLCFGFRCCSFFGDVGGVSVVIGLLGAGGRAALNGGSLSHCFVPWEGADHSSSVFVVTLAERELGGVSGHLRVAYF